MCCWLSPQHCVPQDTGFSSLFLKVLMQTLQWLDSPTMEGGPLQAQLKLFVTQYSARRRLSDGELQDRHGAAGTCWRGPRAVCSSVRGSDSLVSTEGGIDVDVTRGLVVRALGCTWEPRGVGS